MRELPLLINIAVALVLAFVGGVIARRVGLCSFSDQMPKFFISFAEVDQLGV